MLAQADTQLLGRIELVARTIEEIKHEVASAIQTIRNAPFIARRTPGNLPEGVAKQLQLVEEKSQLISSTLQRFGRLAVALRPSQPERMEVLPWLQSSIDSFSATGRLSLVASESLRGVTMVGDAEQLQLALCELIENALEHSPPDQNVQLSVSHAADRLTIEIEDRGTTAWRTSPESIFDPLYSSKPYRLGLGLSVVYAVAVGHGAEIRVEKGDSGGCRATFAFQLPDGGMK